MFIVATKGSNGPLRIGDIRSGATLEEAMAAGDRVNAEAKYKSELRIWKVYTHERPVLVAEKSGYRDDAQWELTARGRKLLGR